MFCLSREIQHNTTILYFLVHEEEPKETTSATKLRCCNYQSIGCGNYVYDIDESHDCSDLNPNQHKEWRILVMIKQKMGMVEVKCLPKTNHHDDIMSAYHLFVLVIEISWFSRLSRGMCSNPNRFTCLLLKTVECWWNKMACITNKATLESFFTPLQLSLFKIHMILDALQIWLMWSNVTHVCCPTLTSTTPYFNNHSQFLITRIYMNIIEYHWISTCTHKM